MVAMNLNTPTYVLSSTSTSSNLTLSPEDANTNSLIVYNAGTNPAFLVASTAGTTGASVATAVFPVVGTPQGGKVIPSGAVVTFTKNSGWEFLSTISLTGTNLIYISNGAGE